MLAISPTTKVFLCLENVDFRKGIDGLRAICKEILDEDPFSGTIFVFRNRKRQLIRLLVYDGQGFWVCTKRLSEGKFNWWPDNQNRSLGTNIRACDLQALIWNGNPDRANFSKEWKKV